jgi:hypothetical protein
MPLHHNASRRSLTVAVAAAKQKGGFAGNAQAAGLKVNSRGKVASRPGPPSRKQQRQMMEEQVQQQQMAPQADAGPVPQPAALQQQQQQPAPLQQQQWPSAPAAPAAAAPAAASMPVSTPQAVTDRMARRVAGFTAVPLVAGLGSLAAFWYLKVIAKVEYPMWAAYLGSTLLFGGSLAGITVRCGGCCFVGCVVCRQHCLCLACALAACVYRRTVLLILPTTNHNNAHPHPTTTTTVRHPVHLVGPAARGQLLGVDRAARQRCSADGARQHAGAALILVLNVCV